MKASLDGMDKVVSGLIMYVAIYRKPDNGCEIQNAARGKGVVMQQLKLVKTATEEVKSLREEEDGLLHGTKVLKELVMSWAQLG
jgi:hypothetical protein